jgi:hypothetical protein
MKKIIVVLALASVIGLLMLITAAQSQPSLSTTTFKAGYFDPKGSKAGFIFGLGYGWVVDEAVDIGIAVDYFRRNYTAETKVAKSVSADGVVEEEIQKEADFTTNILPIYGVINVKFFPVNYNLGYFLSGALGYEMLFNNEQTYGENAFKKTRYYSGFKWMLSGGIRYRVGMRSSFIAELFYDGTKVSRDKKGELGAPVRYQVDLSGLGARVGIRMDFPH